MLFPIFSSIPKAVLKSTKDLMFFFLDRERCCPTLLQMQSFTNTHGCFDGENFSWSIPSISTFSTWMSVFSPFNSTLIYNSLWRGAFFSFISIPLSKKIEDATNVSILNFISQAPCLFYLTGGTIGNLFEELQNNSRLRQAPRFYPHSYKCRSDHHRPILQPGLYSKIHQTATENINGIRNTVHYPEISEWSILIWFSQRIRLSP